jgi:hypothetical protein
LRKSNSPLTGNRKLVDIFSNTSKLGVFNATLDQVNERAVR